MKIIESKFERNRLQITIITLKKRIPERPKGSYLKKKKRIKKAEKRVTNYQNSFITFKVDEVDLETII